MSSEIQAHAVILAGGRGTRFWPLSRAAHPKQLLDLTGQGSLLALTLERLEPLIPPERQWILTSADLADAVAEQAPRVPRAQIIGEPVGRNTAPAVALAALLIGERAGDPPFVVLPSDHLISPAEAFRDTLHFALSFAADHSRLVTLGVRPTRPETGYGYIELGARLEEPLSTGDEREIFEVKRFTEKPDRPTAETYLEGGRHLWNAGIFAWRPSVVLDGLRRYLPRTVEALAPCTRSELGTEAFADALEKGYTGSEPISVDYALLEKADNVAVLPVDFQWNDVGSWPAMRDLWPKDAAGNAHRGEILAVDSSGCIVHGRDRLTALVGVENLIVVQTEDATLVCDVERAQEVREVLEELHRRKRSDLL